jgi:hypothetical protein
MKKPAFSVRDLLWLLVPVLSLALVLSLVSVGADPSPADEIEELNALLDEFEYNYSNERLNDLRLLFCSNAVIATDFSQGTVQRVYSLEDWLRGTQEGAFDSNEHISDVLSDREIEVYRNLAYAVCDYTYIDDTQIGRGVDIFTFIKMRDRWRIVSLQYTGEEEVKD